VLAVAVTVIETALIVSVMLSAPAEIAAVMIVCNGIVGACLLAGSARYREQAFQLKGASAALAVLAALTVLTLVLPNVASPGPTFSTPQLAFEAIVSLALYGSFVFVQTVRHRDYFLPVGDGDEEAHAPPPSNRAALLSASLLVLALSSCCAEPMAFRPEVGYLPPFGSTSIIAALNRPNAASNFFPFALCIRCAKFLCVLDHMLHDCPFSPSGSAFCA